jgi:hypothetical protein
MLDEQNDHFAQSQDILMDRIDVTLEGQHGEQEREMWHNYDMGFNDNGGFEAGEDPDDLLHQKQEAFDHCVHEYNLWSGVDKLPGDVNVDDIAQLWDEEEHDDLLTEVFLNLGLFILHNCD